MTAYTTNLIPNPSFEVDTLGYTPLHGTLLSQESGTGDENHLILPKFGTGNMAVSTDGLRAGEGFITPIVDVAPTGPFSANASGSMHIRGEGVQANIIVSFVTNPGGVIARSLPITLTGDWQRIVFDGVPVAYPQQMYMLVQTAYAEVINFWVDGVQLEINNHTTEYCDGFQQGCTWSGEPNNSPSIRLVEFTGEASGNVTSAGEFPIIVQGFVWEDSAHGRVTSSGDAPAVEVSSQAVFTDFSYYPAGANDPAMTYIGYTNGGDVSGPYQGAYNRTYGVFVPPADYPVSGGALAWKKAAYMAVGFTLGNAAFPMVPGNTQFLSDVQVEKFVIDQNLTTWSSTKLYTTGDLVNYNGSKFVCYNTNINSAPTVSPEPVTTANWTFSNNVWAPTPYSSPRQTQTIVKPTQANMCKNPSFETSLNYWTTNTSNTTISRYAYVGAPSTHAMQVNQTSSTPTNAGVSIEVDKLIVGTTYCVSLYVFGDANVQDIFISCGNGSTDLTGTGSPYGGDVSRNIGFDQGPYGGIDNNAIFANDNWVRPHLIFTATKSTETLSVQVAPKNTATYPVTFWIDHVMIEVGDIVHDYFDGDYVGIDYLWEAGSVPGESRSYYYKGRRIKTTFIQDLIAESTPLGISDRTAAVAIPATQ